MLDPNMVRPPRRRWWLTCLLVLLLVAAAVPAIALVLRWVAPTPRTVVEVVPAFIVVSPSPPAKPAEPAEPAEPTEPAPPVDASPPRAQQVVSTRCVDDITTVGVPVTEEEGQSPPEIVGTAVAPEGCALAAWTKNAVYVSWDGGQTFATVDIPAGAISRVFASADRIVVSRDNKHLGLLYPGDVEITWRTLDALEAALGQPERIFFTASARWIAAVTRTLVAASHDDGRTWRYIALPAATARWEAPRASRITDDGRLIAVASEHVNGDEVDHCSVTALQWYAARVSDGRWRALTAPAAEYETITSGWRYALEEVTGGELAGELIGCGSEPTLVAFAGARRNVIAYALDLSIWLGVTRTAAFAQVEHDGKLWRLAGGDAHAVATVPFGMELVGVDRYDTPIFAAGNRIVRWSKRGGWRELLRLQIP